MSELAPLWSDVLDAVLDAMTDATRASGRVVWPEAVRAELTTKMTDLLLLAADRILDDRIGARTLASIDPASERAYLRSHHGLARARITGRRFAELVWNRVYDEYAAKYPLMTGPGSPRERVYSTSRRRGGRPDLVVRNHFVPDFANKPWADAAGCVLVARHWVDGGVRLDERPSRTWGLEELLYSQWLERYFQAVESDAATAYRNLLEAVPLPAQGQRMFTSFLVVQMLRTPASIARLSLEFRRYAAARGWGYPLEPGVLRRVHERVFTNDGVHAKMYTRLARRRWRILQPADGWVFPRLDTGIVTATLPGEAGSVQLFPLSPDACLCVGPERGTGAAQLVLPRSRLDEQGTTTIVAHLASLALSSLVLTCDVDRSRWRPLLARHLGVSYGEAAKRYHAWGRVGRA